MDTKTQAVPSPLSLTQRLYDIRPRIHLALILVEMAPFGKVPRKRVIFGKVPATNVLFSHLFQKSMKWLEYVDWTIKRLSTLEKCTRLISGKWKPKPILKTVLAWNMGNIL